MTKRMIVSVCFVLALLFVATGCFLEIDLDDVSNTDTNTTTTQTTEPITISNVEGKKMVVVGDSITYGTGLSQSEKRWYQYVKQRYGFESVWADAEIGRAFTRDGMSSTRFTETVKNLPKEAEVIIVFGGVNDYNFNAPIGTMADNKSDANKGITFYAALKHAAETLRENHPTAQIIFMTPLPCNQKKEGVDARNTAGHCVRDYAEAIKTVCEFYGFDVVDLNQITNFDVESDLWLEMYMPDGLHPNVVGVDLYLKNGVYPALDILFELND